MTAETPTSAVLGVLEQQRDQWLRSLDQLDAERAAGDLSDDDHRLLTDRYSAELAAVLRRIEQAGAGDETATAKPKAPTVKGGATRSASPTPGSGARRTSGRSRWTRFAVLGAVAVFAVGAGVLLAQTAGERGVNDQITGEIDVSSRSRVARCQELGSIGTDLLGALECFDEVLLSDPDNAEALSYRGWYLLLAAGSLQQAATTETDDANADELIEAGLTYLDRAIEVDPLLPDPLAFRATVHDRLGLAEEACADVATLLALDPPPFFVNQTAGIAQRNGC
ncbi:MAG: hypothetical protein AAGD35_17275 [Actinomycetota bacterium]